MQIKGTQRTAFAGANQGIQAIAFDMDGTLVDTESVNWQIVKEGLEAEGLTLTERDKHNYMGTTIQGYCENMLKEHKVKNAEQKALAISESKIERFPQLLKEGKIKLFTRVIKLLEELAKKEDLKIALVTNSKRDAMEMIKDHFKLGPFFNLSYGREDAKNQTKPNPYIYRRIIKEFGIEPNQLLVFEDSETGIEAASKAEATVMAIKNTEDQSPKISGTNNLARLDMTQFNQLA